MTEEQEKLAYLQATINTLVPLQAELRDWTIQLTKIGSRLSALDRDIEKLSQAAEAVYDLKLRVAALESRAEYLADHIAREAPKVSKAAIGGGLAGAIAAAYELIKLLE